MNLKKIVRSLLFPHPAVILIIAAAANALLTYGFIFLESTSPLSIASYVLSFYALMTICLRSPQIVRFILRIKRENKYISRFSTDVRLRMNVTLFGACVFNAIYACFQLVLGLWHLSVWFYTMAAYYLLLAMMRLLLMRYTRSHTPGEQQEIEWKKYRVCGGCLMAMNLALGIMIAYFVLKIRTFRHHEITTIAMAAYSFTALILAIRNAIRYTHYKSPAYSAAKAISLAAAIVSMLTLENAMLTTFGEQNSLQFQQIMLGASGVAVLISVHAISVYMLRNSSRRIRVIRKNKNRSKSHE